MSTAFAPVPLSPHPGSPLSGARRVSRLALAAVIAVAAHGVVLMPLQVAHSRGAAARAADAVTIRLVDSPLGEPSAPVDPPVPRALEVDSHAARVAAQRRGVRPPGPHSPPASAPPIVAAPQVLAVSALPPAPDYRFAAKLDPGPSPLGDIEPIYPERAGQQQGRVVLRLLINEQGMVDNAAVVSATPVGFFEEAALEAFSKAHFAPGKLLGVAVKSQVTIEVEFTPINRGAAVSGRTY